jgi:hypothetical protein
MADDDVQRRNSDTLPTKELKRLRLPLGRYV